MSDRIDELLNLAVGRKRQGDIKGAEQIYYQVMAANPREVMVYYGLGKLYYLTNERERSIANYLIAAHLSLQNIERILRDEHDVTSQVFKMQLAQLPQEMYILRSLVHPLAPLLFLDPNTPRHLAHALIDLDSTFKKPAGLYRFIRQYRRVLSGDREAMSSHLYQLDWQCYRPIGIQFIMDNLQWNEIENQRPDMLYDPLQDYVYASDFFEETLLNAQF